MTENLRVAIVTGAAGGIGRPMTRALLAAGIRVAGVDRDREPLEALAASAREQGKGPNCSPSKPIFPRTLRPRRSPEPPAIGSAALTSWSTMPASVRVQFDLIVGNGRSSSGRSLPISGAASSQLHTTAPLALTNAVVPEMMRQGWGRIVNVTTSLGTMINPGFPTYGPSKAALEALSAIMAKDLDGTGVTVNVLVPGGITNTPMVSESGFDRAQMIQPEVMAPPLLWLVSDAAGKVTGRRFLGVHWDPELPPEQAAEKAGAPVAWTSIATMPITPSRS